MPGCRIRYINSEWNQRYAKYLSLLVAYEAGLRERNIESRDCDYSPDEGRMKLDLSRVL